MNSRDSFRAALLSVALAAATAAGCVNLDRPSVTPLDGPAPDVLGRDADRDGDPAPDAPWGPYDDAPIVDAEEDSGDGGPDDGPSFDAPPDLPTPDLTPFDGPLLANGRPCAAADQCLSGNCVDQTCCESTCTGACAACNRAGSEGSCSFVPAGEDPSDECPQDPLAMCRRDGTCNGAGACRMYALGTECAAGSCQGTTETAASTCDGAGTCRTGASRTCPGGGMCMGTSCGTSCTADASCQGGFFCDANVCRSKRTQGVSCSGPAQCASGFCADGVCCATACTEMCRACNVSGSVGTCTAVPDGQDPRNVCPADPISSCGRNGFCNGAGGCRLYGAATTCGVGSCSNGIETPAPTCNGLGTCGGFANRDCGAYLCAGNACASSCTSAAQCAPGYSCTNARCAPSPGLVMYWRLDESGGGLALDSSGNGRAGSYVGASGAPTSSPSVPPVSFSDAASRAFLRAPRHAVQLAVMPAAIKPVNALTVSVWYRATTLDTGGSELVSAGDVYILRLRSDGIEFTVFNGIHQKCVFTDAPARLDGNWHHLAGVLSDSGLKAYFDGVERCSVSGDFNISYTRGPDFWVGRHGNGGEQYDFEGNVDEVRIYNRGLSAAEIARLAAGKSQL